MRSFWLTAAILLATICGHPAILQAQGAAPSAVGLWEKTSESGKPDGWFRIFRCGDAYAGQIVKMFPKKGENPSTWRCTKCTGSQKDAPVLGLTFIKNMRRDGLQYEGGTILDPRDGSVYNAIMELSPDGQQLTVRGYVFAPFLGQSEVWHRIHPAESNLPKPGPNACPAPQPQSRDLIMF